MGQERPEWQDHLTLIAKTRVVLNFIPAYPGGSHERLLACLAQGTLCLSTPTSFLSDQGFEDGRDLVFFDSWEKDAVISGLERALQLSQQSERRQIADANAARIRERHSSHKRAQQIIEFARQSFPQLQQVEQ